MGEMRTLNKNRPYCHVFGLPDPPHTFVQDGRMFDQDGNEVVAETKSVIPEIPDLPKAIVLSRAEPVPAKQDLTLKPEVGNASSGADPAVELTRNQIMDMINKEFPGLKYNTQVRKSLLMDVLLKARAEKEAGKPS